MKRSYLPLVVEGTEYGLRLTIGGQRRLKERWQEESLQFLLSAATEPDKLCDLLTQALSWPGSGNPLTDGGELYDRLVDAGWRGQERFAALAFDLGEASGLLTREQADQLTRAVARALDAAFPQGDE